MSALPAWADNPEGRALLDQIIANPPETRIRRDDWGAETIYRTWKRPDVAALKRMYADWWEANFETASNHEKPDALIARLLRDREQIVDVEHLGEGRIAA